MMNRTSLRKKLTVIVSFLVALILTANTFLIPVPVRAETYSGTCGNDLYGSLSNSVKQGV